MTKTNFEFDDLAQYNRKQDEWRKIPTKVTVNLNVTDEECREILATVLACTAMKDRVSFTRPLPETLTCDDPWEEALYLVQTYIGIMPRRGMDYPNDVTE